MNDLSNNKPHIDKRAAILTAICMAILCICLILFGFSNIIPEEETGMLINFGNSEMGSGQVEPPKASAPVKQVQAPPPPPKPVAKPVVKEPKVTAKEDLNTQDFEEAAAIEAAKAKAEKEKIEKQKKEDELERQQKIEKQRKIDEQRKLKEEQDRIEEIERQKEIELQKEIEQKRLAELKRIEDERKAKEAKAEAIRQQTSNAFGKSNASNNSTGEGVNGGEGNQGDPNGSVNSTNRTGNGLGTNGNWSLAGRSLVGSLPKPNYKLQKEGVVVVEIAVDKSGNVLSATPILRGSTTQDAQLWKLAKEAALSAKFNANPSALAKQVGTITYHFVLN